MEKLVNEYFEKGDGPQKIPPTVEYFAGMLNISAHYLSDSLRVVTGVSAQYYIHEIMIDKAKEKLSSTDLTISEIAYGLGFEYPQSFSKLFKKKTQLSPVQYREKNN